MFVLFNVGELLNLVKALYESKLY